MLCCKCDSTIIFVADLDIIISIRDVVVGALSTPDIKNGGRLGVETYKFKSNICPTTSFVLHLSLAHGDGPASTSQ